MNTFIRQNDREDKQDTVRNEVTKPGMNRLTSIQQSQQIPTDFDVCKTIFGRFLDILENAEWPLLGPSGIMF